MSKLILGVDVGGVITDPVNDDTDKSFLGPDYLGTTAVPGAFEALRELRVRLNGLVYVVSKCKLKTELKTRRWLAHHRFYDVTGISPANVFYCRERHEKAPICEDIGATHFIDDRLEVLGYLTTVPNKILFRPKEKEVEANSQHLPSVTRVESWAEALQLLR